MQVQVVCIQGSPIYTTVHAADMMEFYEDMDSDLFWDDDFMMNLDDEVPSDFDETVNSNLSQQSHQEQVEMMEIQEQDEELEADSQWAS